MEIVMNNTQFKQLKNIIKQHDLNMSNIFKIVLKI